MKRLIAAFLMFACVLGPVVAAVGVADADANQAWLIGKWELSLDPDGNEKDWLQFSPGGKVTNLSPGGDGAFNNYAGSYVVSGDQVQMSFTVKGRTISLTLTVAPDKKKLLAFSKRTGNTSEYTKVSQ